MAVSLGQVVTGSMGGVGGPRVVAEEGRGRMKSVEELDVARQQGAAYEYLCHLEEAKNWISTCINQPLPQTCELEENFRNGVYFAKLGHFCAPKVVPERKIFDKDLTKYKTTGLHFKHTDNINYFIQAIRHIGLPECFLPETTDIYDRKNMPRAIFCIHALSLFMFKIGAAPQIQDLLGRLDFSQAEISACQEELDSRGVDLPSFHNIGGMLCDTPGGHRDMSMEEAVARISAAVEEKDLEILIHAMSDKRAKLKEVEDSNVKQYMMVLRAARAEKSRAGLNHAEIQGHVTRVNLLVALDCVLGAVRRDDVQQLVMALRARPLGMGSKVEERHAELYLTNLVDQVEKLGEKELLSGKEVIVEAVLMANELGRQKDEVEAGVAMVNKCIQGEVAQLTVVALQQASLRLPQVNMAAADLYHDELKYIREETGVNISYEGIEGVVAFLNLVAATGVAALAGDKEEAWRCLSHPDLAMLDLDGGADKRYGKELVAAVRKKGGVLTHGELQEVVDLVNRAYKQDFETLGAVQAVNEALRRDGGVGLCQALRLPGLGVDGRNISSGDEVRYLCELRELQRNRSRVEGVEMELWLEDIVEAVETVQRQLREVESVTNVLRVLNSAVRRGEADKLYEVMSNNWQCLGLEVCPQQRLSEDFLNVLQQVKVGMTGRRTWVEHWLRDEVQVWVDLEEGVHSWLPPRPDGLSENSALGAREVSKAVNDVVGGGRERMERLVVKLQARVRGYLVRKKLFCMLEWYYQHQAEVIKVQALWRGKMARRRFMERLEEEIRERQGALAFIRNIDVKEHEKHALVIQRAWRKRKSRQAWAQLLAGWDTTLATVRKYLHLLDTRETDFREELEVQSARGDVSKFIRNNEQLEAQLDEMDIKIGLLVQNRISVQDVMNHQKTINIGHGPSLRRVKENEGRSRTGSFSSQLGTHRGIKALRKESHDRLKAYQHLFYLLQTEPNYLARLMFAMPQSKTTKFLESVILTLYNFGSNQREEFLLLQLFRTALQEEVATRVNKLNDVVMGNPLVVKMVVSYNRNGRGVYSLRELLGPLIQQVLDDKTLQINTNPVEVYKLWVNQLERESGNPAGLSYDVSQEVALQYQEVQKRLERSIANLKRMTTLFLTTLIRGRNKLPYGILYMSKVLGEALREKFPDAAEKDLLKVVGNLVYYRYINPTIVAPDRFDMVEKKVDTNLNNDQRRNLGSIAKILQFAASKKGFGDESQHLMCLNPFIIECHETFKQFFKDCCDVEEPENQFNIDKYTEAVLIAKPTIFISLTELCDTHQLLIDHTDSVAPTRQDPLHPLLVALGSPSLCSLLGAVDAAEDNASLTTLGKTEVCLTLSQAPDQRRRSDRHDRSDMDRLWVKTKHLLLAILPATPCGEKQNLIGVLKSRTLEEQEKIYCDLLDRRDVADKKANDNDQLDMTSVFCDEEGRLPLEDAKRLVLKNLRILEVGGYTSSKNSCQSIVTDIAKDILNQREYRIGRRRELVKLRQTRSLLAKKQDYMLAQLDQYKQYITHCLGNLNRAGNHKRVHFSTEMGSSNEKKIRSKAAVKQAATKLYDKGILLTIEGLPPAQLKNVQFVFIPMEQDGLFEVSAKFMGVDMETVVLDIQNLLKLQYEGVAVMDMFGKAKINVNLILHFLNTKFYGK